MPFFQNIATVKQHLEVNSSIQLQTLQPKIKLARTKYMEQLLGGLMADLEGKVMANVATAVEMEAIALIRAALIHFAFYEYVPTGAVQLSDSGIHRAESERLKSAYRYQETNLRYSLVESAWLWMEQLLLFLEANILDFPAWGVPERNRNRNLIINNARDFNLSYQIKLGRYSFEALRSLIEDVEVFTLEVHLGEYYRIVKAQLLDADPEPRNIIPIRYMQKVAAYFTMAEAVKQKVASILPDGTFSFQITEEYRKAGLPRDTLLALKIDQAEKAGNRWLKKLTDFLADDAATYPEFKEGDDEGCNEDCRPRRNTTVFNAM